MVCRLRLLFPIVMVWTLLLAAPPATALPAAPVPGVEEGRRMSVAVLAVDGDGGGMADDYLMGALLEGGRFRLVEREKLAQVKKEQKLVKEGLTAPEHSIRLGKLAGADALLSVTLRQTSAATEAACRAVVTETSETFEVAARETGTGRDAVKGAMAGLASRLARLFPIADGKVVGRNGSEIRTDIGSASGVRRGMGAILYRPGKPLVHPVTGREIGRERVRVGEGIFADVAAGGSTLKLTRTEPGQKVRSGDIVATR